MASLMEMIGSQIGGSVLKQIAGKLGSNEKSTGTAVSAALPVLLGALSRNANKPDGAQALSNALSRDHDGSILENLSGFLNQGKATSKRDDGDGILRHLLGSRRSQIEGSVAKTSGLDAASSNKLMAMLAPVLMGAVGKQKREQNLDAGALAQLLSREHRAVEAKEPKQAGLVSRLLDQDNDGDVDLGDIAKAGLSVFGKFLK